MNDPEAKKEMENLSLPKMGEMPDMSEMISKFLGGGTQQAQRPQQQQAGERTKNKKRNNN